MLPRAHRLRSGRDFELVHRRGRRYAGAIAQIWVLCVTHGPTRIGITTSRKVGNAIRRNRLRRLIRESVREVLSKIAPGYKIVVVVRPRVDQAPAPTYIQVREEIHRLLTAGGVLTGEAV